MGGKSKEKKAKGKEKEGTEKTTVLLSLQVIPEPLLFAGGGFSGLTAL